MGRKEKGIKELLKSSVSQLLVVINKYFSSAGELVLLPPQLL